MKLQHLLDEYREALPRQDAPAFAALLEMEKRRQRRRTAVGLALAMAASFALVLALTGRPAPVVHEPVVTVPAIVAAREAEAAAPAPKPEGARPVARHAVQRQRQVIEFFEIAEARTLPKPAMVQIVRVNVNGAKLVALGVLPADELVKQIVTADLLVGDDGMARAIRVVNQEEE